LNVFVKAFGHSGRKKYTLRLRITSRRLEVAWSQINKDLHGEEEFYSGVADYPWRLPGSKRWSVAKFPFPRVFFIYLDLDLEIEENVRQRKKRNLFTSHNPASRELPEDVTLYIA
jgi:hypothetical protein